MNKYQNKTYGYRTRPDLEEGKDIFIQLDATFLEIENCSQDKYVDSDRQWDVGIEVTTSKQVLEKWGDLI
jgi:hypothetical protein